MMNVAKTTEEAAKIKLVCNECGKKRMVSPDGNFNDRCPKCGGVDWDVL
jgi:Zn finger protein HypA/HybF involved in hydrogenase expression